MYPHHEKNSLVSAAGFQQTTANKMWLILFLHWTFLFCSITHKLYNHSAQIILFLRFIVFYTKQYIQNVLVFSFLLYPCPVVCSFHASFHEDIPICLILEVLPNIAPLVWPVKLCYLKQNSSAFKPLQIVSALYDDRKSKMKHHDRMLRSSYESEYWWK